MITINDLKEMLEDEEYMLAGCLILLSPILVWFWLISKIVGLLLKLTKQN